jgi:hypothetical protein
LQPLQFLIRTEFGPRFPRAAKDKCRDPDARVFSTDQIADYFDRQQPELVRREIDLICSHFERSVKS